MKDSGKTIQKLLEALAEAISEDEQLVDDYLKSSGKDPKEIEASGERFIQNIKGQLRYNLAREQLNRFNELKGIFLFKKNKLVESSKEKIAQVLSNGDKLSYQTYYRKLETLTEKDLEEINNEQEFLKFLEDEDK